MTDDEHWFLGGHSKGQFACCKGVHLIVGQKTVEVDLGVGLTVGQIKCLNIW